MWRKHKFQPFRESEIIYLNCHRFTARDTPVARRKSCKDCSYWAATTLLYKGYPAYVTSFKVKKTSTTISRNRRLFPPKNSQFFLLVQLKQSKLHIKVDFYLSNCRQQNAGKGSARLPPTVWKLFRDNALSHKYPLKQYHFTFPYPLRGGLRTPLGDGFTSGRRHLEASIKLKAFRNARAQFNSIIKIQPTKKKKTYTTPQLYSPDKRSLYFLSKHRYQTICGEQLWATAHRNEVGIGVKYRAPPLRREWRQWKGEVWLLLGSCFFCSHG